MEATPTIDYSTDSFRQWLTDNSLVRGAQEKDIDFARRAFDFLCDKGINRFIAGQDRTASKICVNCETDAGGFSFLYCAILRANGVPARALVGRMARTGNGADNGRLMNQDETYVKAEFYAAGVGWVPVDIAQSIGYKKALRIPSFGLDDGQFLTMEIDPDLVVNTYVFGYQHLSWMQSMAQWIVGSGSAKVSTPSHSWEVVPASSAASASNRT
ncbi:MAG TPA: transglutaminase-like domain-containing protein [Capsulimonadaceae bacterium]|nr:transglutaminase-like domain-containing protein [Capsulimonadaceae bacterium]